MQTMDTEYKLLASELCCIRQQRPLFKNISFELTNGDALLIEGANGSGKSSLLRLLSGLATPTSGDVFWCDRLLQNARLDFAENLHYVGHSNGIKLGLTIAENLELSRRLCTCDHVDIDNMLSLLQLDTHKHSQARFLSAGQKRRIALAKLFLFPKKLWILDEPLTALDAMTQELFLKKLNEHLEQGGIAIISSHHSILLENAKILRLSS